MKQRLLDAGVDRAYVRRMTERLDNLRLPLKPNREASLRDDPDTMLLRLLFCGMTLDQAAAEEALGPELLSNALLVRDGDEVRCPFHLRWVRDLLLVSDYLTGDGDAVMGAGETTAVLYQAARPARRVGSVLDLGCGAGTLALLLAADSDRVVGTDVNERAVRLARFNAELNAIGHAEFRTGDVYAPVEGEKFDLLVSQPPYYPMAYGAPQTFLHGGVRGDELAVRVVDGVPGHLTVKGRALLFVSWPEDVGPRRIAGMDVVELSARRNEVTGQRQTLSVFQHAEHGGPERTVEFTVSAENWGLADSARIDELFAIEALGDDVMKSVGLRLPSGLKVLSESDQILLQFPDKELVGCVPVTEREWLALQAVDAGSRDVDPSMIRSWLRRGLLRLRASE